MRIALDSNVLLYAEGIDDANRQAKALRLTAGLPGAGTVIPVQVLGEVYSILHRKARRAPEAILAALAGWQAIADVVPTDPPVFMDAAALAAQHGLQIWDAVILATAEATGCTILLSEDMQHGFQWRRITVVNPFVEPPHPLLASVLAA